MRLEVHSYFMVLVSRTSILRQPNAASKSSFRLTG